MHSSAQLQIVEMHSGVSSSNSQLCPAVSLQRYHTPLGDGASNRLLFFITVTHLTARIVEVLKWEKWDFCGSPVPHTSVYQSVIVISALPRPRRPCSLQRIVRLCRFSDVSVTESGPD